jgi:hypothetical protein
VPVFLDGRTPSHWAKRDGGPQGGRKCMNRKPHEKRDRHRLAQARDHPGSHRAFTFDFDYAAILEIELTIDHLANLIGDVD